MRNLVEHEIDLVSGATPPPPQIPGVSDPEILRQIYRSFGQSVPYGTIESSNMPGLQSFGPGEGEEGFTQDDVEWARGILDDPNASPGELVEAQNIMDAVFVDEIATGAMIGATIALPFGATFVPGGAVQGATIAAILAD